MPATERDDEDYDDLDDEDADDEESDDDEGEVAVPPATALPAVAGQLLAPQVREAIGLPASVKLRFREDHGGWSTVDGDFLGRNLPTILVAARGTAPASGRPSEHRRLYLTDGTWVSRRLVLAADVEAAKRGIAQVRRRLARN